MKICTDCKEEKALREFCKRSMSADGLQSRCRRCRAEEQRHWREKNPGYRGNPEKSNQRTYKWGKEHRFSLALIRSRFYAKKRDYFPCSATPEELEIAFIGYCHACGLSEEDHGQKLCIDHDHETGEFRGWLCHSCNVKDVLAVA